VDEDVLLVRVFRDECRVRGEHDETPVSGETGRIAS
jgi:hypothetical protein